jgi:acyl carrier protein
MDETQIRSELKSLIVKELNLQGRDPASIQDEAPLFGPPKDGVGLGLDSLDALQLAMSIEERFGVRLPEGDEARPIFRCVATIAAHIHGAGAEGSVQPADAPTGTG